MTNVDLQSILTERGSVYGDFRWNGEISQKTKDVWQNTPNWSILSNAQREALDMLALKVSRILSGDPNYLDNWVDGAGYMQRIAQIVEEDEVAARAKAEAEAQAEKESLVPSFLRTPEADPSAE